MAFKDKSSVTGTPGNDDLRADGNNANGTLIRGGAGDDILRGGKYADVLEGESGNDQYFGGASADQFRFFGNEIDGASDRDFIRDLNFAEGDTLVFGNYAPGTFSDFEKDGSAAEGVNAFNGGSDAQISSYEGIVEAAGSSSLVTASRASPYNDNLKLTIVNGTQEQEIIITGGWSQYVAAGGTDGL